MSEPDGPSGEPGAANGQLTTHHADRDPDLAGHDSWFEPAARPAGQETGSAGDGDVSAGWTGRAHDLDWPDGNDSHQAEWFLRTGRAGLLPESMTESWEEHPHAHDRPPTAADPPWAGERDSVALDEAPPPWESGPWPEPGEGKPEVPPEPVVVGAPVADDTQPPAETANWQATAALATGILPLVVPGVVLGVLGLRRASVTGAGRMWSWLGIALSVIWAIVLVFYLAGSGGQPGQACGGYQNDVNLPVAQVLRDLANGAPQSVLVQDLHQAISQANSAAAAVQQVTARNAMVSLTAGLQQALETAGQNHPAYAAIRRQLSADAAAAASSCKA
jgi:hypothetical protein